MRSTIDTPSDSRPRARPGSPRRARRDRPTPSLDDFAAASPKAGTRLPEVALGLLVVASFALATLWWFTSATEKIEVIALSNAVERGEVVDIDDLVVASINSDDPLATIDSSNPDAIVGRVALASLPAGTVLTPSMFAASNQLVAGVGIVGMELDPGQRPGVRMLPGDLVSVVLTPDPNGSVELTDGGAAALSEILVDAAVVIESAPLQTQGREFVALSMTEAEAQVVAVAASQDRVRLIQVARDSRTDALDVQD